jgi:hypothetical protein
MPHPFFHIHSQIPYYATPIFYYDQESNQLECTKAVLSTWAV